MDHDAGWKDGAFSWDMGELILTPIVEGKYRYRRW